MCNPRRINVTATRELREAWEQEVARAVTRTGSAVGQARMREQLDASIGGPTLVMLERALETAEGWIQDGDSFRYDMTGGYVAYHSDTQELELVAEVSEEVSASEQATETIRGEFDTRVEAGGTGVYYDDGYGGITAADARRAAEADAQRNLDRQRQGLLDQARAEHEVRLAEDLERRAAERADASFLQVQTRRSAELAEDAADRLTAIGIEGRNAFHQVLAGAYRDAIVAYARARGADGLSVVEHDGVMEIEFEMEA
jgi:hypothetical protein